MPQRMNVTSKKKSSLLLKNAFVNIKAAHKLAMPSI